LKVSTEKIPDAQILMTIEVESERLDEARKKAVKKLTPKARVPGFRPGKAPANMVRQYFGEERVLDEALDDLVPVVYREAMEADENIDPIARPRLVIETTEPLVVKATIPVAPTVELGDYNDVRVEVEDVVVEDSRIDDTMSVLRKRAATLEPIERELAWNDVCRINVNATVGEEQLVNQDDIEIQLSEERDVLFPGFEEALLTHKKGETVEFDLPVPEDVTSEKFAGKEAHFVVAITETKREVLPDVDEVFLKAVGEGFETEDDLRTRIREDIQKAEEEQRLNKWHDEVLTAIVEKSTIEFPPVMLESEVDRMIHDQASQVGAQHDMERYFAAIGRTAEQLHEELHPVADARLRRSLVLGEVAEAENIEVSDGEIGAEVDKMVGSAGPQGEQLRQLFDSENGRGTIRRNLMTRKTLARLVEIATEGKVPAATALAQDGGEDAEDMADDVVEDALEAAAAELDLDQEEAAAQE
jgi:trigger factor